MIKNKNYSIFLKSQKNKILIAIIVIFVILVVSLILGSMSVETKPSTKNDRMNKLDNKIKAMTKKLKNYPHFLNITPDKNLFEIIKIIQNFKGNSEYTMFLDLPSINFDSFNKYNCDIYKRYDKKQYNVKNIETKKEFEQLLGSIPGCCTKKDKYPFKSYIYPGYYYLDQENNNKAEIRLIIKPIYIEGMNFKMEISGQSNGFNQLKPLDDLIITKYKQLDMHNCQLKKEADNTIFGFTYNYVKLSINDKNTANIISFDKMISKMQEEYNNFEITLNESKTYFSVSDEDSPKPTLVLSNPDNPQLIYSAPSWYFKEMNKLWEWKRSEITN